MASESRAASDLPLPVARARAAATKAIEVRAQSVQAVDRSVTVVKELVARHGDHLRPTGAVLDGDPSSLSSVFTTGGVSAVRRMILERAGTAGLSGDSLDDFVVAVQELLTNAIRHGGGWGHVRLRLDRDELVCTLTDHGPGFTAESLLDDGPPPTGAEGGRGLFLTRRLTDGLRIDSSRTGSVVTVTMRMR